MKIAKVDVESLAFPDPPVFNSWGLHEPLALRTMVRIELDDGTVGWGEGSYGLLNDLDTRALTEALCGLNPLETEVLLQRLTAVSGGAAPRALLGAFSPLEVACLDAAGHRLGVRVVDLLGGAVRDSVEFSAYLFYKWAAHPGQQPDRFGEALDPAGIVTQARKLVDEYGFSSLKLKAGVRPPDEEIAALDALAEEFPGLPLRIDPNGAWTVPTTVSVMEKLGGRLEYLEDPVLGIDGMAEVRRRTGALLATNMCVVERSQIKEGFDKDAVQIVLSDHHYWGGLRRTQQLAATCQDFGVGVSMHSNSHLGISLAAMTAVAATIPNIDYACDTHYPWNCESDIVRPGTFAFDAGSLPVLPGPGLGVEIDEDKLAELRENFRRAGRTSRDDTGYLRRFVPDFDGTRPRF